MPEIQSRGSSPLDQYDAMSTEALQALLREDASKPVGEPSDADEIFYVMEVLARRRKERKSPEEALASFRKNYCPERPASGDSGDIPAAPGRGGIGRRMKGLIAAAAMLALILGGSITARARGFDLWQVIAQWTQETFHLEYAGDAEKPDSPSSEYANPCASLCEALNKRNIRADLVPAWLPEGYVEGSIEMAQTPKQQSIKADYTCGEDVIIIRIADYLDGDPMQIEKSGSLLEVYTAKNTDYYIFNNYDILEAVWICDHYECCISGPLSIEEIKEIIDSIEKG